VRPIVHVAAFARAWTVITRCAAYLCTSPRALLVMAASAPFIPGFWQFARLGIPDVLYTGDDATLEIRTLHAAHGTQLLGPYSRFQWSHPGPAFFYLALPTYETFFRRGPALNLFALIANLATAIALVLCARRLRGGPFAFVVAIMLAVYESAGAEFQLAGDWNPVVPILPLGLLSLLCARLALGAIGVLPLFAFLASAMVQTHVGFLPVASVLSVLAATLGLARRPGARLDAASALLGDGKRHVAPALGATALILLVVWAPPLLENATSQPGNLQLLYRFFTAPHPPEHTWPTVFETASRELAVMPLAIARAIGLSPTATTPLAQGLAIAQAGALCGALAAGLRRADRVLTTLASIALGEVACSFVAVRFIRGEISPHQVFWISIIGLISAAAMTAWLLPAMTGVRWPGVRSTCLTLPGVAILGLCVRLEAQRVVVFSASDERAERLAREIDGFLVSHRVDRPVVRIASHDTWPTVAAVILYLYKRSIPIFVERNWLFMMGAQFAPTSGEHPTLVLGDRTFYESARTRPDLSFVSLEGDVCAFLIARGPAPCGFLSESESMAPGHDVVSCDGRFTLSLERDGNLVLQGSAGRLWASDTSNGSEARLQDDGNFMIRDRDGAVVWTSGTSGNPGARLAVQDDGNAVIYSLAGTVVWASHTCCH
jgi:hypothetical protein